MTTSTLALSKEQCFYFQLIKTKMELFSVTIQLQKQK